MNGEQVLARDKLGPAPEEPRTGTITWRQTADFLFHKVAAFAAFLLAAVLFATVIAIGFDSWLAIQKFGVWHFLITKEWDPVTNVFGAFPFIVGTLVSSAIAMILSVPISFGVAVFIAEVAPSWIKKPIAWSIELLAAIPSIVYGLWGLLVFAPVFSNIEPFISDKLGGLPGIGMLFQGPPMGIGMLTAGIVLAIMVLPYISSIMRDVFIAVPGSLRESAYAMGSTTWEVAWHIVLPYGMSAVIGGIFLGLGRAVGETIAVTFFIVNSNTVTSSVLMPGTTIPSVLANEFTEATSALYRSSLIYLGLILLFIALFVRIIAAFLLSRLKKAQA